MFFFITPSSASSVSEHQTSRDCRDTHVRKKDLMSPCNTPKQFYNNFDSNDENSRNFFSAAGGVKMELMTISTDATRLGIRHIYYGRSEEECQSLAGELLHFFDKDSSIVVGFDTEWRPTCKRKKWNRTALIQIAFRDSCYLFPCRSHWLLPSNVVELITSPRVFKIGVSISTGTFHRNQNQGRG